MGAGEERAEVVGVVTTPLPCLLSSGVSAGRGCSHVHFKIGAVVNLHDRATVTPVTVRELLINASHWHVETLVGISRQ